ncbi:MAG: helix-turn-helix domain-containing protein [Psychrobacter sp.]|jgi:hypothetical protein
MSQANRVLDFLETGRSITPQDAWNELGITRLAARVHELKKDGYVINKKLISVTNRYAEKCQVAEYYLEGADAP